MSGSTCTRVSSTAPPVRAGVVGLGLAALFLAGPVPEPQISVPATPAGPTAVCSADIEHPLVVRVVPLGPVRPGLAVAARVQVQAGRLLDDVTLRVSSPQGVALRTPAVTRFGNLRAGDSRLATVRVIAPATGERRTVEIRAEATVDGLPVSRGAILNLAVEEEPHRVVQTPDGRRVREVAARRIG